MEGSYQKLALLATLSAIFLATSLHLTLKAKNQTLAAPPQAYEAFSLWQTQHKRLYASPEEYNHRVNIFYRNSIKVTQVNTADQGWTASLNKFADLSSEEFVKKFTGFNREKTIERRNKNRIKIKTFRTEAVHDLSSTAPGSVVDWNEKGIVTQVRNQRDCGGCYAFTASEVLQAQNRITGKGEQDLLSPQEFIDCSGEYETEGCDGGPIEACFDYAWVYGVASEKAYPYKSRAGKCGRMRHKDEDKTFVKNYYYVDETHDAHREHLREIGPIGVVIDGEGIQLYEKGVYKSKCKTADHAVLMVGYGVDKKAGPYYKILNSWGEDYGENGFFRVKANEKNPKWCELLDFSVGAETGMWDGKEEEEDY